MPVTYKNLLWITSVTTLSMLCLIFLRFLTFKNFVDESDVNAVIYTNFAFWNALLPFISIGIPIGQNAVFPKRVLIPNDSLSNFYRSVLTYGSFCASIIFILAVCSNIKVIIFYSCIQLFINILIQQFRYEFPKIALATMICEISFLGVMIILQIQNIFDALFIYYTVLLLCISAVRIFIFKAKYIFLSNVEAVRFNLISLMYKTPTLVRENIDIIMVGLMSDTHIIKNYAIVIICSAPAKVIFSSLITGLNFMLARLGQSYKSYPKKLRMRTLLYATALTIIICPLITFVFFQHAINVVYVAVILRSANIALSSFDTMRYLDEIQENLESVPFARALIMTGLCFIACATITHLTQHIAIIASLGFLAAIFTYISYGKYHV
jgi:hypothetical protein